MGYESRIVELENKRREYIEAIKRIPQRIEEARKEEQRARESSILGYREYPRFTVAGVEEQRQELQLRLQTCERWLAETREEIRLDQLEERIVSLDRETRAARRLAAESPVSGRIP